MSQTAIVAGSSGLVGTALLHQLCASEAYSRILLLVRRPSGFIHPKVNDLVVDFDRLEDYADRIRGTICFCCLGSTRKKTPDKQAYYRIDHDYPLAFARIALAGGAQQFHLVSAIGADPSAVNFYLKMKGEADRDIGALPFDAVHIYRPSFLAGNREERRPLERVGLAMMKWLRPLMAGPLKKYRSIEAEAVAGAMLRCSLSPEQGVHYYSSDRIQQIADES